MQPGTRVGALFSSDPQTKTVKFLGYGKYLGDEVPFAEINPILNRGLPNPKIELDNGEIVWGMECWWGVENVIKQRLEAYAKDGWTIQTVSIVEERNKRNQ